MIKCKMTSVDSGIETSNNSNDSSIAQNDDPSTGDMNNGSTGLVSITNTQIDYREIKPVNIQLPPFPQNWTNIPFTISRYNSSNQNFALNYTSEVDNSIPTSSSGRLKFNKQSVSRAHRRSIQNDVLSKRIPGSKYRQLAEHIMRLAAATNNTSMMKRSLMAGNSPNNCDKMGRTPLHLACCRGYTEMVHLLLEHGANPNLRDSVGNTPLHLAAVTSKSVVTLLLNAGVDPTCLDQDGYNPLQLVQTKLLLLQSCRSHDSVSIKEEVQNIVSMLLAYLQKHRDTNKNVETLATFCSRLSLSGSSKQVQDEVKDLLAHIDALSITQ